MPSQSRGASLLGWSRRWATGLLVGVFGVATLVGTEATPSPNGLGLLPGDQQILESSGVTLETPGSGARIGSDQAIAQARLRQPGTEPLQAALVEAVGADGSRLSPPGRLCWLVFLEPTDDTLDGSPLPGVVRLDAVLVDARSGRVIEGFISFGHGRGDAGVGDV